MIPRQRYSKRTSLAARARLAVQVALLFASLFAARVTIAQGSLSDTIEAVVAGGDGDGGPSSSAIVEPFGVTARQAGSAVDLYIADRRGSRVRKVSGATNTISTIAGTGTAGFAGDGGAAINAQLNEPTDVVVDPQGNIYVSEFANRRVRKIDTSGVIRTIAGNGIYGFSGDGGSAVNASIALPYGLALDGVGNLFIADFDNHRVRKVTPQGTITTVAGNGVSGYTGDGGQATQAALNGPSGVAVDGNGNLYICDYLPSVIRKVTPQGIISTVAGVGLRGYFGDGGLATQAQLNLPFRVSFDSSGNLLILDRGNNRLRRINASGVISTIAGNGLLGSTGDGGSPTSASLYNPSGLAAAANNIYIGTSTSTGAYWSYDNRIRLVTAANTISTLVGVGTNGDGGPPREGVIDPYGLSTDGGPAPEDLYIADSRNSQIRKVDWSTGTISTVAGNGTAGFSGDGGGALQAQLSAPTDVAYRNGTIWIADRFNSRIRRVDPNGTITTVAGNGVVGYSGDGGDALSAALYYPQGLDADAAGNLYIADTTNNRVRKVTPSRMITTVAGTGVWGYNGDNLAGNQAQLKSPTDVAVASDGSLFIAENGGHRIRKLSPSGTITTFAGNGNYGSSGDGGLALNALLNAPFHLDLDGQNNLFLTETANRCVRRIDAATGVITRIAGSGALGNEGDGGSALVANLFGPTGIAVDAAGHVYISQADSGRIRAVTTGSAPPPSPTLANTPRRTPTPTSVPATATPTPTSTPTWTPTMTPQKPISTPGRPTSATQRIRNRNIRRTRPFGSGSRVQSSGALHQ